MPKLAQKQRSQKAITLAQEALTPAEFLVVAAHIVIIDGLIPATRVANTFGRESSSLHAQITGGTFGGAGNLRIKTSGFYGLIAARFDFNSRFTVQQPEQRPKGTRVEGTRVVQIEGRSRTCYMVNTQAATEAGVGKPIYTTEDVGRFQLMCGYDIPIPQENLEAYTDAGRISEQRDVELRLIAEQLCEYANNCAQSDGFYDITINGRSYKLPFSNEHNTESDEKVPLLTRRKKTECHHISSDEQRKLLLSACDNYELSLRNKELPIDVCKIKLDIVNRLKEQLNDSSKLTSVRIQEFHASIKEPQTQRILTANNDSGGRILLTVIGVILSGIIPGLAFLLVNSRCRTGYWQFWKDQRALAFIDYANELAKTSMEMPNSFR